MGVSRGFASLRAWFARTLWARGDLPGSGMARDGCGAAPSLLVHARDGITEIVYQPTGPDIPGELERFITIARDV
jgi:hypothetical protein